MRLSWKSVGRCVNRRMTQLTALPNRCSSASLALAFGRLLLRAMKLVKASSRRRIFAEAFASARARISCVVFPPRWPRCLFALTSPSRHAVFTWPLGARRRDAGRALTTHNCNSGCGSSLGIDDVEGGCGRYKRSCSRILVFELWKYANVSRHEHK